MTTKVHSLGLEPETKYLFVCHHKTGTHLLYALCQATAAIMSDFREECHWCLRPQGLRENGTIRCPIDHEGENKAGRTEGGRFTLISAIDGMEWRDFVLKWATSHRVVHVVRDPKDMIISDLQYNQHLMKRNKTLWDCDQNVSVWLNLTLKEQIQNISYAMSHLVDEMCKTSQAMQWDENATSIRLEDFEADFPHTSGRMFSFLFGNHSKMPWLMRAAAKYDLKAHPKLTGMAVNNHSRRPEILEAVNKLVEEGDWRVKGAASCEGAKDARSWNTFASMKKKEREAVERMLVASERYDGYWEM